MRGRPLGSYSLLTMRPSYGNVVGNDIVPENCSCTPKYNGSDGGGTVVSERRKLDYGPSTKINGSN